MPEPTMGVRDATRADPLRKGPVNSHVAKTRDDVNLCNKADLVQLPVIVVKKTRVPQPLAA